VRDGLRDDWQPGFPSAFDLPIPWPCQTQKGGCGFQHFGFDQKGLGRRGVNGMFSAPKARVGAETSTREVAREKLRWEESGKGSIALKHAQQLSPGDQDRNSTDDCVSQV
jgi:hypothetical protein